MMLPPSSYRAAFIRKSFHSGKYTEKGFLLQVIGNGHLLFLSTCLFASCISICRRYGGTLLPFAHARSPMYALYYEELRLSSRSTSFDVSAGVDLSAPLQIRRSFFRPVVIKGRAAVPKGHNQYGRYTQLTGRKLLPALRALFSLLFTYDDLRSATRFFPSLYSKCLFKPITQQLYF